MPLDFCKNQDGFTLMELLVALALTAILTVTIGYTFRVQALTYRTQEEVAALQQNLRTAMFTIEADLRLAGSDPTNSATDADGNIAGILSANSGTVGQAAIQLSMNRSAASTGADFDTILGKPAPGVPAPVGREIVRYDVKESQGTMALRLNYQAVAEGITNLQFNYYDKSGISLLNNSGDVPLNRLNEIRRIRTVLTGQTPGGIMKVLTSDVWCRNMAGR